MRHSAPNEGSASVTRARSDRYTGRWLLAFALLACWGALGVAARAQSGSAWMPQDERHILSVGHDASLGKGEKAASVVSILGSAHVAGDVDDSVVAVLGDAHVSGSVGDSTVAVLGDAYINSKIEGDVVAVIGNVTLGPQADVEGQVVEILGTLDRSPTAAIEGGTVGVLSGALGGTGGLRKWVRLCMLYARPLAPAAELAWAWSVALAALVFYLLLAAIFRDGLGRCVQTLDTHPGQSLLAALVATLLVPTLLMVLVITLVGVALIPFVWLALLCAGIFGRVVALGWLGGRCLGLVGARTPAPAVLSVLVGGIVALALYMVPVLGFLVFALLGVFGFGALVYTLVLAASAARARPPAGGPRPAAAGAGPGAGPSPPEPESGASTHGRREAPFEPGAPPHGAASAAAERSRDWWNAAVDPHAAATHPRAGFWVRMGALLLDLVLVGFALSVVFYHGFRGTLVILAAYAAIMWKLRGTTIGGLVFDLQVARIDGRPIDWGTAIVRALSCFLSLAALGLGFLWIAFDPEHQAWHDKIAGTVVVRAAKATASEPAP